MTFNIFCYIILVIFCVIFPMQVNSAEPCHLREVDLCMSSAVVFVRRPSGKINEELIERQCQLFRETEDCIEKFTRDCMTKSQHQLVDFATGGMLKTMRNYCTKGSNLRKQFLKHGECVEKQRKPTNVCLVDFQAAVEKATSDSRNWKERPKVMCCGLDRYINCMESIIGPACGTEALEIASSVVRGSFSRAATITCSKYKYNNPECQRMLPPSGTIPKGSKSNSIFSKLISTFAQA